MRVVPLRRWADSRSLRSRQSAITSLRSDGRKNHWRSLQRRELCPWADCGSRDWWWMCGGGGPEVSIPPALQRHGDASDHQGSPFLSRRVRCDPRRCLDAQADRCARIDAGVSCRSWRSGRASRAAVLSVQARGCRSTRVGRPWSATECAESESAVSVGGAPTSHRPPSPRQTTGIAKGRALRPCMAPGRHRFSRMVHPGNENHGDGGERRGRFALAGAGAIL